MSNTIHKDVTTQEVQTLLIEGAKYSASDDVEKAAKCYARILDLESQSAEIYLLLARSLYRLGLKRNDVFGGGDDGEDDENDDDDDEDGSADEDDKENAGDAEKKQKLNSKLYQFDQEEEDVNESTLQNFEDATNASAYVDARGESILQSRHDESKQQEDDEEPEPEADMSIGDTFEDFLQGNLFENALELLYRARIMYMEPHGESKEDSEDLSKDTQLKLAQLYDLLGDIDQELEDFTQAVRDYEGSLRFYDKSLAPEEREVLVEVYLKLTDALRWSDFDDKDSLTKEQRQRHLQELEKLIRSRIDDGTSKDTEADQSHLERLQEDQESLKLDKPKDSKSLVPELMAQAILRQALGGSQGKVNDLSKMVKKKRTKSSKNKGGKRK
ncbi:hypothetical protein ZYGR_0AG00260 [Zygosaccharomyces rouxii]|uniref:Tetratricopeptide SHNi-TPR domain-containing protein n=1 Tax=Zygosaccharomyces rouxii TaxID=4956 RepID=A0A1Q3A8G4_ZYGRO|nr:hypothetical protein ZYGR_0AG00260 [Zygosaccharomyces rouxii]